MVRLGVTKYRRLLGARSLTLYLDLSQVSIMSSLEKIQDLCVNVPYSDLAINIVRRKADVATDQRCIKGLETWNEGEADIEK